MTTDFSEIHLKLVKYSKNAEVFLDRGAAECFHWSVVKPKFLDKDGALAVKELSCFSRCFPNTERAVFITTHPIFGSNLLAIKDVIRHSPGVNQVIVITSVSPTGNTLAYQHSKQNSGSALSLPISSHANDDSGNLMFSSIVPTAYSQHSSNRKINAEGAYEDIFEELEETIGSWMATRNDSSDALYNCEVIYIPFDYISPLPNLILSSSYRNISSTLRQLQDFYKLSQNSKSGQATVPPTYCIYHMKLVADYLNNILENFNVRDDVYAIGKLSSLLASEIAQYPPAKIRRKKYGNKASLILVDRLIDTAASSSSQVDNLLDLCYRYLPQFATCSSDVGVSLLPLVDCTTDKYLQKGCLADPANETSRKLLGNMAQSKLKEGLMELQRSMMNALVENQMSPDAISKVSSKQIASHAARFKSTSYDSVSHNAGLLQAALAVDEATRNSTRIDENHQGDKDQQLELQRLEKAVLNEADNPEEQENLMVKSITVDTDREGGVFNLDSILAFLSYCLTLIRMDHTLRDSTWKTIRISLTHYLCGELKRCASNCENSQSIVLRHLGISTMADQELQRCIDKLIKGLKDIRHAKQHFHKFRGLVETSVVPQYKPILSQIVGELCKPSRTEHPDFELKSTGLTDRLKSGLGYFVNVSKPHPADTNLVIIFILGNITFSELRMAQEIYNSAKPNFKLKFGALGISKGVYHLPQLLGL